MEMSCGDGRCGMGIGGVVWGLEVWCGDGRCGVGIGGMVWGGRCVVWEG